MTTNRLRGTWINKQIALAPYIEPRPEPTFAELLYGNPGRDAKVIRSLLDSMPDV